MKVVKPNILVLNCINSNWFVFSQLWGDVALLRLYIRLVKIDEILAMTGLPAIKPVFISLIYGSKVSTG